jgi:hypothetical protein
MASTVMKIVHRSVPALLEYKFYARDVGPVLVIAVSGATDREELVSNTPAAPRNGTTRACAPWGATRGPSSSQPREAPQL